MRRAGKAHNEVKQSTQSEPVYSSVSDEALSHTENGSFIIHLLLSLCFLLLFLYPSLQRRKLLLAFCHQFRVPCEFAR
jgi:hypothetical protein